MLEEANPSNATGSNPSSTPETAQRTDDVDAELKAINAIVVALSSLNEKQRLRALDYVLRRFDAQALQASETIRVRQDNPPPPSFQTQTAVPSNVTAGTIQDIRTLKEVKSPKSCIEMAALVAYYISEVASEGERKKEITKSDVERYFKMAGFKLPADAAFTLNNAKNAGYLDSAGAGQYTLNPVGYNLVAHRMGTREVENKDRGVGRKASAKRRPNQAKKAPSAKK